MSEKIHNVRYLTKRGTKKVFGNKYVKTFSASNANSMVQEWLKNFNPKDEIISTLVIDIADPGNSNIPDGVILTKTKLANLSNGKSTGSYPDKLTISRF